MTRASLRGMDKPRLDTAERCACGGVTLSIKGRVRAMLLCACRDCRKATGTGHAAAVVMGREAVRVEGETRGFETTAASGSAVTRHFCPACGTPLFALTARAPGIVLLPAGLFEEPDWFAPTQAIFTRSHLAWDTLPEHLPAYRTYRTQGGL